MISIANINSPEMPPPIIIDTIPELINAVKRLVISIVKILFTDFNA